MEPRPFACNFPINFARIAFFAEAQPKPTHAEREQQRRGAAQKRVADAAAVIPQKGLPLQSVLLAKRRVLLQQKRRAFRARWMRLLCVKMAKIDHAGGMLNVAIEESQTQNIASYSYSHDLDKNYSFNISLWRVANYSSLGV